MIPLFAANASPLPITPLLPPDFIVPAGSMLTPEPADPLIAEALAPPARWTHLSDRGVLRISGEDRLTFLQGLVTADLRLLGPDRPLWAALLTPQGKYLHDFLLVASGEAILVDAEAARLADLARRLSLYKLRAKVRIEAVPDWGVAAAWGSGLPAAGGLAYADPRRAGLGRAGLGLRRLAPCCEIEAGGDTAGWDRLRILLGVPDGSRDLVPEKSILMESGFDELGGIAWDKGCYIGQELTARTKYRGLVRKRLLPAAFAGPAPAPGTPVITAEGKEMGEIRSGIDGLALALLRLAE